MSDQPRHPGRRDVAVAALLDDEDRVLLVRTRRLPDYWQPVGGGVEPADGSFLDAAARELREELGVILSRDALRFELSTSYDFGQGEVRFFSARLPGTCELVPNRAEIEELCWSKVSAALQLPAFPATQKFLRHLNQRLGGGSPRTGRSNGSAPGSA